MPLFVGSRDSKYCQKGWEGEIQGASKKGVDVGVVSKTSILCGEECAIFCASAIGDVFRIW